MPVEKILVPLDDSGNSEGIIPYLFQIASNGGAIMLVTVKSLADSDDSASSLKLASISCYLESEGLECDFRVVQGEDPAQMITDLADQLDYNLIAMSTRGKGPLSRAITGSVTQEVLRTTTIPLLAITPSGRVSHFPHNPDISMITVGLDGSSLSELSLPYVEEFAHELDVPVRLVQAVQPLIPGHMDFHANSYFAEERLRVTEKEMAAAYLAGIASNLRHAGVEVACHSVLEGNTTRSLIDSVEYPERNLFVITTHGRSGVDRLLMGCTAESIVRESQGPVLVVPSAVYREGYTPRVPSKTTRATK